MIAYSIYPLETLILAHDFGKFKQVMPLMQSFLGDNPLFGHKLQEADTYESHKLFCHIRFYLFSTENRPQPAE